jgi:hypothetical protein
MFLKPLSDAKIIHDFLPSLTTKRHNIVIAPHYMNTDAAVKAIEGDTEYPKIYVGNQYKTTDEEIERLLKQDKGVTFISSLNTGYWTAQFGNINEYCDILIIYERTR